MNSWHLGFLGLHIAPQVPFVGSGEGEVPWYRVLSEKATKERLWEVGGVVVVVMATALLSQPPR